MTRAVIELSGDISPAMPHLSQSIEGCAYNPEANLMAFRLKDMPVLVESHQITIYNAEDEETAKTVMDWLNEIMNNDKSAVND